MSISSVASQLSTFLSPDSPAIFHPVTGQFIKEAYGKIDLDPQRYCALARRVSQAIYHLPLQSNCPVPAGQVMDSSIRILAHLKVVDLLEEHHLDEMPGAATYISWVQKAAKECMLSLAQGLARSEPLKNIYVKNPVRIEIDVKGGWSDAVSLPSADEVRKVREEILRDSLKLVFFQQIDVRAYLSEEKEKLVSDKTGILYQSIVQNRLYFQDPNVNLEVYPHESQYGRIFANFLENREFDDLKQTLIKQVFTKMILEKTTSLNNPTDEERARLSVEVTTSESSKKVTAEIAIALCRNVQSVVDERKKIKLTPVDLQVAHVQDHYPIDFIVKEVVDPKPINELRDAIYQKAYNDSTVSAPSIKYPRISYYAGTKEDLNILNATYAVEYLEGKNPQLLQLVKILNIGIERFVRAYQEQQKQLKEQKELQDFLLEETKKTV